MNVLFSDSDSLSFSGESNYVKKRRDSIDEYYFDQLRKDTESDET